MGPRRADPRLVLAGLVVANLVPLVGVVGFGWRLKTLMVVYWLEFGVVTARAVAKVRRAAGEDDPAALPDVEVGGDPLASFLGESRRAIAASVVSYYGFVWVLVGMFVLVLPFQGLTAPVLDVALGTLGVVAYHAVAYRVHYVESGAYRRSGPVAAMADPHRHLFVLVLTVLLGGIAFVFLVAAEGLAIADRAPVAGLVVMVLAKSFLDVREYRPGAGERR